MGFDAWVHACTFGEGNRSLKAELELRGRQGGTSTILATMDPGRRYTAAWNGKPAVVTSAKSGTLQITLPSDTGRGSLTIVLSDREATSPCRWQHASLAPSV